MFIIVGGTGHVGSATTKALLRDGQKVTVVTRNADHAQALATQGATVAVADLHDVARMRDVLRTGKRLYLLNPPAAPDTDTDAVETESVRHLLSALDGSGLEKIVGHSTYGARPGKCIGDFGTLHTLEKGLADQPIPHSILRAAYYMSNWNEMLAPARDDGVLPTMYPADMKLPMVAPDDLGEVAARLLTEDVAKTGIHHAEGPDRYSSYDVAKAFSTALERPVKPVVTPPEDWESTYRKLGFSDAAARSYAGMTRISAFGNIEIPDPIKGSTTLQAYIHGLVKAS
jgi:uncharacterized protein YbjT (DUF2867 family)